MTEDNAAVSVDENIDRTVGIVSAFVSNNTVAQGDLSTLIATVHQALGKLSAPAAAEEAPRPTPAVPVKRSVQPDFIVCLEDGLQFKSLRRHLRASYDLTPDQYRARWGLPPDYPMVAPNYAAARSELAKRSGLGQVRKKAPPAPSPAAAKKAAAAKKVAGRRPGRASS
ncbi:MucR family transcriptional regulator [Xanthobacter sp. DSM 14520]|uniref:MucR family transcriptional regulator n=1 Tax=Xanthobacter autotrophicus (strain ATCC BAA-1158 / Py2) TaxID=78245 RepID=UPI00372AC4B2